MHPARFLFGSQYIIGFDVLFSFPRGRDIYKEGGRLRYEAYIRRERRNDQKVSHSEEEKGKGQFM
jgi:hypothetical protein